MKVSPEVLFYTYILKSSIMRLDNENIFKSLKKFTQKSSTKMYINFNNL